MEDLGDMDESFICFWIKDEYFVGMEVGAEKDLDLGFSKVL